MIRDWRRNKIPEKGGAGFACTPFFWDFIIFLNPKVIT
jgi:hypothetical protein